jgi:hypothetical protein
MVAALRGLLWRLCTHDTQGLVKSMIKVEHAVDVGRLTFRSEATLLDDIAIRVRDYRTCCVLHALCYV